MKKLLALAILVLGTGIVKACPSPTGHAIINFGAVYEYTLHKDHNANNLGGQLKIGYEIPLRYFSISAVGAYHANKTWKAGGEIAINPLGIDYGYNTPINFLILLGAGYKHNHGAYISPGLELYGHMGKMITPFISCTFNIDNFCSGGQPSLSVSPQVGVRLWLGKYW